MAMHKGVAALSSFFPGSLAALLSFSNWEHKTPLQKTEAKASATEELLDIITQNNTARKQHTAPLHITVIWEMLLLQRKGTVHMYFMKLCLCSTKEITFMTEILTFVRKKKKRNKKEKKKSFVC